MKNYFLIIIVGVLMLSACHKTEESKLNIAVAANMQFAMKELVNEYEALSGVECQLIISSSGKLTAQIREGAPYDIFVSANMKYPQDLFDAGFTTSKPEVYAYGNLVLWSKTDDMSLSLDSLNNKMLHHIALANPKMAPYGMAAQEVLENLGLYESLEDKLVFGESIAQCNQFIISKSAEMGFTAKSVVFSQNAKDQGHWIDIDPSLYTPIAQGAVIIKQSELQPEAKAFYEFLFSEKAAVILKEFGYHIQEEAK